MTALDGQGIGAMDMSAQLAVTFGLAGALALACLGLTVVEQWPKIRSLFDQYMYGEDDESE